MENTTQTNEPVKDDSFAVHCMVIIGGVSLLTGAFWAMKNNHDFSGLYDALAGCIKLESGVLTFFLGLNGLKALRKRSGKVQQVGIYGSGILALGIAFYAMGFVVTRDNVAATTGPAINYNHIDTTNLVINAREDSLKAVDTDLHHLLASGQIDEAEPFLYRHHIPAGAYILQRTGRGYKCRAPARGFLKDVIQYNKNVIITPIWKPDQHDRSGKAGEIEFLIP